MTEIKEVAAELESAPGYGSRNAPETNTKIGAPKGDEVVVGGSIEPIMDSEGETIMGGTNALLAAIKELVKDRDTILANIGKEKKKKTGGTLKGGPMLYQVDPSGSYFPWKATAIGKSATSSKTFLEKRYTEGLELEDAVHIALLTLKETIEGEMNGETVEIGIVGPPAHHLLGVEGVEGAQGPRFRKLTPQEIEDYLTNL